MAPLKMIITVIVMMLAALLGSKPAGAGQIGGIDQFLRNVTDVLHQIEDNIRPPFPTAWFQATLILALVWMLAPLLVNVWDAIIRGSKRVTSLPEAERTCSWIHPVLQGLDKFIHLFRDHHTTVRHQTMIQAITSLGSVFTEEAVVQARRERDDAIESHKKIKAAKSLVDVELEGKASSLKKAEADFEKVRGELSRANIEIGRLLVAAEDQASRAKHEEMLKRLDDIEECTKKLEEDAVTMAKKQAVATSGENDG
ncbi:hypothetical protein OQA88_13715 [Cercophora sp. LCS_1]